MDGSRPIIRVLGPVRVLGPEGPVPLGGPLPRAVIAVLGIEAGRLVPSDRLASLLWGDEVSDAALYQTVTRARRALGAVGLGSRLRLAPPGYVLDIDPAIVDVLAFRSHLRVAAELLRVGSRRWAADEATAGLALWEGPALADLRDLPLGVRVARGIDSERSRAEELRAQALVTAAAPGEAADHLAEATARDPLSERLWVLQGEALAAAGRTSDALACVRHAIAAITSELGAPPGHELIRLERRLVEVSGRGFVPPVGPTDARKRLLDGALQQTLDHTEHAADAAARAHAHGEAVRQWQRALELLDLAAPDDDHRRLRALLALGAAHNAGSVEVEARTVFERARQLALRLGDASGVARAVLGYCGHRVVMAPPPEQDALLQQALDLLGDTDPALRCRLLARLATNAYWSGPLERTAVLAEEAWRVADAADDAAGRLEARYAQVYGCWSPDQTHERLALAERYLEEALCAGDSVHELLARRWIAPTVAELGDLRSAQREIDLGIALADELGLGEQQWISRVAAASLLLVKGDLDAAETTAVEALALGTLTEPQTALDHVSILLWTCRWLQGRLAEVSAMVEEVAATPGVDIARRMGLALTRAELGRTREASELLDAGVDDLLAMRRDASWFIAMVAAAEASALVDHRAVAEVAHGALSPYCDRLAVTTITAPGPIAHQVGITAWVLGRTDDSLAELRRAVDVAVQAGAPLFAARSRRALAQRLALAG
ncbi:MAG TPA: BTAD domain-containing putative transcriptional regulator [Acidimicrobiales bacterium]